LPSPLSANKMSALIEEEQRDRELLRRLVAGDRAALHTLYLAYQQRLLQFLSRLSNQRDSLEEAVNDTFWIVWRKAAAFRGESRVSTWIMGIAWRCALKSLRRNSDAAAQALAQSVQYEAPAAAEMAGREERDDWLSQGLELLPMEQRATLQLAYLIGYSCEEIATIMECPVNTVKARMFQARIKLRNLLPKLGGNAGAVASRGGERYE
jgi:RNA polymerase sigma-70 factor, ECF subfamily